MLATYFDKIYIINLPERKDRKDEINEQLGKIGLDINHPSVYLFPAIKPNEAGEFPTIGTRGCFLSHLSVLIDAAKNDFSRILIIEDDLNFSNDFNAQIEHVIDSAKKLSWNVLYLGHVLEENITKREAHLEKISSDQGLTTTHFIAFQGACIKDMIQYLDKMQHRKSGDPMGGPMHVDGAYSWYRREHPQISTYACLPALGYQRASRTDIHAPNWFDQTIFVRDVVAIMRKFKNLLR